MIEKLPDAFLEWFILLEISLLIRDLVAIRTDRELDRILVDHYFARSFEC